MAARARTPEDQLNELVAQFEDATDSERMAILEDAVNNRSNLVVEYAARMVVENEVQIAPSALIDAWDRFAADGRESDKNCRAKLPIVEALNSLNVDEPDFFTIAIRYVQMEPVWGKSIDTAAGVRGAAAFGLIRCRSASPSQTLLELVDLLSDPEPTARTHAATAIGQTGLPSVTPLLRLKARSGDRDCEVIGECFRGLLEDSLATNLDFVADYLKRPGDLAVEAAAALAATRRDEAVERILNSCLECSADQIDGFYLSLGLARTPAAIDFLLQRIADDTPTASIALKALQPSRFYPEIRRRTEAAVKDSGNARLRCEFQKQFRD